MNSGPLRPDVSGAAPRAAAAADVGAAAAAAAAAVAGAAAAVPDHHQGTDCCSVADRRFQSYDASITFVIFYEFYLLDGLLPPVKRFITHECQRTVSCREINPNIIHYTVFKVKILKFK